MHVSGVADDQERVQQVVDVGSFAAGTGMAHPRSTRS